MSIDEAILESAVNGQASLRFYTWTNAWLTLGYFQPAALRLHPAYPAVHDVPYVRRPSGGAAILHHHEVTYCLALPPGEHWHTSESWVCRFHGIVASALAQFKVQTRSCQCGEEKKLGELLCFLHQTPGDLLIGVSKVVGSAQRRPHRAVMQHGSILLRQSHHTPELPGIEEIGGVRIPDNELIEAILAELKDNTGWELAESDLTHREVERTKQLNIEKYSTTEWNQKY